MYLIVFLVEERHDIKNDFFEVSNLAISSWLSDFDKWEGMFFHSLAILTQVVIVVDGAFVADSDNGIHFADVTSDSMVNLFFF